MLLQQAEFKKVEEKRAADAAAAAEAAAAQDAAAKGDRQPQSRGKQQQQQQVEQVGPWPALNTQLRIRKTAIHDMHAFHCLEITLSQDCMCRVSWTNTRFSTSYIIFEFVNDVFHCIIYMHLEGEVPFVMSVHSLALYTLSWMRAI